MRYLPSLVVVALLALAADTLAQTPPIFGGGVGLYDPEIDVFNVGAVLDAQVVVSEDRRYVTINARPSQSGLINLAQFQTTSTQVGFVGGGNGAAPNANRGSGANSGNTRPTNARPPTGAVQGKAVETPAPIPAGVLGRQGIFQLSSLPAARPAK